jgi:hypothetical protein
MSSNVVLVLWDPSRHGTPKSFSDVISAWNNLEDVEDSPSERILAFAQQVQEQALKNPEDYEDYVDMVDWISEQTTALIEIDLPTDDWQRPLVLLAETAMACKLVGIAESLLIAFLPTGKILPPEQTASWKGLKAFLNEDNGLPRNIKQYKKLVEPMCDLLFTKHGYTKKGPPPEWKNTIMYNKDYIYYTRDIQIGYQEIRIDARKGRGMDGEYFFMVVSIRVVCMAIYQIYKQFEFDTTFKDNTFYIVFSKIQATYYNRSPFGHPRNPISREQINTDFMEMETLLFPFLNQACDIQALDKLMNGDINPSFREEMHRGYYAPHCLIVARLAGNPHFEALVLSLMANTWGLNDVTKLTESPKLVKYLREEVKPLV